MKYVYFVVYTFGAGSYTRPGRRVVTLTNEIMSMEGINQVESEIREDMQAAGYCLEWFVIVDFKLLRQEGEDGKPVDPDYIMVENPLYEKICDQYQKMETALQKF